MELITVKQYAQTQRVSYEAVRRQLKRYSNELRDHIIEQNRTRYLDAWAVEFLTKRRRESPIILMNTDQAEENKRLKDEIESLRSKLMTAQNELLQEKDKIIELQYEVKKNIEAQTLYTALLEDTKAKEERLTDALKEVEDLRKERDAAQAEAASYTKTFLGFYRKK